MDKVEVMARAACEWEGSDPDESLGGDQQNFRWMEAAETLVSAQIKALQEAGHVIVPITASAEMVKAGAPWGSMAANSAMRRKIYAAMVQASQENRDE